MSEFGVCTKKHFIYIILNVAAAKRLESRIRNHVDIVWMSTLKHVCGELKRYSFDYLIIMSSILVPVELFPFSHWLNFSCVGGAESVGSR